MFRILLVPHQGIKWLLSHKTNMKYLQLLFRTTVMFYMKYEMLRWWIRRIFFWQVTLCTSSQSLVLLNNTINLNVCLEGLQKKNTKRSRHNSHRPIEIQNTTAQWHWSHAESSRTAEFTWLYLSRRVIYPASERNLAYPRLYAVSELRRFTWRVRVQFQGWPRGIWCQRIGKCLSNN